MNYAETLEEAKEIFEKTRDFGNDPLKNIPPSLLSSIHIRQYVEATGMLCPFSDKDCKGATVVAKIGGEYKYWDKDGNEKKGVLADKIGIGKKTSITLEPNSIAFIPIDLDFLLPDYIAARFNLKVQHVYKGLLLGTGPLIDPGYEGRIWIPLHNFTANEYKFEYGEELILIEFTKIFPPTKEELNASLDSTNRSKAWKLSLNDIIKKAVGNGLSVISSIPDAINEAKESAKSAEKLAEKADNEVKEAHKSQRRWNIGTFVAVIGILVAVVGIAIAAVNAIATMVATIHGRIDDSIERIEKIDRIVGDSLNIPSPPQCANDQKDTPPPKGNATDKSGQTTDEQSGQTADDPSSQPADGQPGSLMDRQSSQSTDGRSGQAADDPSSQPSDEQPDQSSEENSNE